MPRSLGLVALLLLAPLAHAQPAAPTVVTFVTLGEGAAFVTWAPAGDLPDGYAVYGIADGAATRLATVSGASTAALVPAGYAAYGVTAIVGGAESPRSDSHENCVYVAPHEVPPVSVGVNCAMDPPAMPQLPPLPPLPGKVYLGTNL